MNKRIFPVIAIVGSYEMARKLSERFSRKESYFAIIEEPWVSRPDANLQVLKLNNLIAVLPHNCLVIAGCSDETRSLLKKQFPDQYLRKIIEINFLEEVDEKLEPVKRYFNKNKVDLPIIKYEDVKTLSVNEQVGAIEASNSIGEVIAENFCLANNYKILKIEFASDVLRGECEDLLRDWNCGESSILKNLAQEKLFSILRERVRDLEFAKLFRTIFFTIGLPYGVLPFNCPVAHLFSECKLGLQILRGYRRVTEKNHGISVALICDPGEIPESETDRVKKTLRDKDVEIVDLTGKKATSFRFMHLIERYPFDFAMISSHAGEIDGRRITEEFISSKGIKFKIVYDLYASFAPVPGEDEIIVYEMTVPISINDIPWSDKKRLKEDESVGYFDIREFFERDKDQRPPIKTEDCRGVKFTNALKLYKLTWIPALHVVGEGRYPIIFNNACSSWIEMAGTFVFAGASVYIGTTKDINTTIASSCGAKFVALASKRNSMLHSLFYIQNKFIAQLGYSPYMYWGHPDVELRPNLSNKNMIRKARVAASIREWNYKISKCKEEDKKKIKPILDCITEFQ